LITGVAESYYIDVIKRNPHLQGQCLFAAIPYGSEASDHQAVKQMGLKPYLFKENNSKLQLVYAGAMLPKAYQPLEAIFKAIQQNRDAFSDVEFHFIGSGKTAMDPNGYNIKPLAMQYGLWQSVIFEYPKRIPYLDVLQHLNAAGGVFILGSTEPHYTPSKVYQAVLSGKPIFAVLHEESTAVTVIRSSNAGIVLDFKGPDIPGIIEQRFYALFSTYRDQLPHFDLANIKQDAFEKYTAKDVTRVLSSLLDQVKTPVTK
jgi:hypothetical protein